MVMTCLYMCCCSRFVKVGDDGHMRLYCCGKAVTGIGNVPKWEPVRRGKQGGDADKQLVVPAEEEETHNEEEEDEGEHT